MAQTPKPPKETRRVETLRYLADTRRNIPTAEFQSMAQQMDAGAPVAPVHYPRAAPLPKGETRPRNADLDPQLIWRGMKIRLTGAQRTQLQDTGTVELGDAQLVWRGKDARDWSDLVVNPPPIYIQEKVHPKAIIDGLQREVRAKADADAPDLFADFNGLDDLEARLEFYQHDQHWSNRMILGDSLQVMASLAEREGLRGKVQCIYFDPPYGIKFNSNWQVSTQSRDVKDGKREDMSREPEQVQAFRDTWKDGIHSYLAYLRDRLTVARELLTESGSIFLQIGEENVHRVRALMDEVFGEEQFVSQIAFVKAGALGSVGLPRRLDHIIWFSKTSDYKYRPYLTVKSLEERGQYDQVFEANSSIRPLSSFEKSNVTNVQAERLCRLVSFTKPGPGARYNLLFGGHSFVPGARWWGFPQESTERIKKAGRLRRQGNSIASLRMWNDYAAEELSNLWTDTASGSGMDKVYVVQTASKVIQRCILMATDPGDLVLDPTCGSGTTATVAEQWGRRWITIDTSRVALALARTRLMAAKYPYYLLADSREGRTKEQAVSGKVQGDSPTHNDVRHGFVYERAPHVTLKSIANNAEIDALWDNAQQTLAPLCDRLNAGLGTAQGHSVLP